MTDQSEAIGFMISNNFREVTLDECNNASSIGAHVQGIDFFKLKDSKDQTLCKVIGVKYLCSKLLAKEVIKEKDFIPTVFVPLENQVIYLLNLWGQPDKKDTLLAVKNKNDKLEGFIRLCQTNIDLLKKIEKSEYRNRQLNMQLAQKDDFLSIVCHDLRNPLGVINACVEYIIDDRQSTEKAVKHLDFLERIKGNVNKTSEMINNLLDMSRIKSTGSKLDLKPTYLHDYLHDIKDNLQLLADKRGITIRIPDKSEKLYARIDPPRFSQIIENLVINAIKFSPKDTVIEISCKQRSDIPGKPKLAIEIKDQGYGIPEDKITTLFSIFEQGEGKDDIKSTGFGVGLFIVRQFTQLHHGKIEVKNNEEGGGSQFSVVIPEEVQGKEKDVQKTILLVEDDDDVIEFIQLALENLNYRVLPASNGIEAAQLYRQETVDLVISDLRLPGKDGFELLQEIKNIRPNTPYILMTGYYENIHDRHVKTFFKADKILHKPFTNEDLEDCIQYVFSELKKSA